MKLQALTPQEAAALAQERPVRTLGIMAVYTSRYDGGTTCENVTAGMIPAVKARFEKYRKPVRFVRQVCYPISHWIEGHGWIPTHKTVNVELDRYDPPVIVPRVAPTSVPFVVDDGGRTAAGYKGLAGDCVARSIAIASSRSYAEVYARLSEGNATQRASGRRRAKKARVGKKTAAHGICTTRKWFADYMEELGFAWVPTMGIGTGCTVHLRPDELPKGRLIVSVSKHMTTMIDGVLHDTYDCSRQGTRCVYGYYVYKA